MKKQILRRIRTFVFVLWITSAFFVLYFYFFQAASFHQTLSVLFGSSLLFGYLIYLTLGILRGFFLIPVTYFIIVGLLFFPPWPLYILTLLGIIISSTTIYFFADFLDLDTIFEKKYPKQIAKLRQSLEKNELPIVILWSFLPFTPTDIICYTCGALEINFKKFILGVFIGESTACALYIFLGEQIFRALI